MLYTYKAKIIAVYDGDTVTASADLGFFVHLELNIRLEGINTPELRGIEKIRGIAARDRLRELVLNREVILHTFKDKQEKYGRWLARVYLEGIEESVNAQLIREGHAIRYMEEKP